MLRPAPLLAPTPDGDPIAAPRNSFDRIRLFAHRQARGELDAGIDAIRAYATVGMLVAMHGHAIGAAAASVGRHGSTEREEELAASALALLAARQPWAQVLSAAENCTTMSRSAPLLAREVAFLSNSLGCLLVTRTVGDHRPRWCLQNRSSSDSCISSTTSGHASPISGSPQGRSLSGCMSAASSSFLHANGTTSTCLTAGHRSRPTGSRRCGMPRAMAHAVSTQTAAATAVLLHASTISATANPARSVVPYCCRALRPLDGLPLRDAVLSSRGRAVRRWPQAHKGQAMACPWGARQGPQRLASQGRPEAVAKRPKALDE